MIIAGDVGGTKTRLGLFLEEPSGLKLVASARYPSSEYGDLSKIVARFVSEHKASIAAPPRAACFGIPGPIVNGRVKVTNLPWEIDERELETSLGINQVKLVNDLISTAAFLPRLTSESVIAVHLGLGSVTAEGTCLVVAPGTGTGHAFMYTENGVHYFLPSEAGHANFAPSTDLEIELLKYLRGKLPHVSVESVLCGPGLVNIFNFLHEGCGKPVPPVLKEELHSGDRAGTIATHGVSGEFEICTQAVNMFCRMLGAHSSNLALSTLATNGVFLGGGIPPKIATAITNGSFMEGYLAKVKCRERVEATPVSIIKDDSASLYGAGFIASRLRARN